MNTPAPHSSAGHSRLSRWILPFSSTWRRKSVGFNETKIAQNLNSSASPVAFLPCSIWARRAWPSSSCACSSWGWCRTSSSSFWHHHAASAPSAELTPENTKKQAWEGARRHKRVKTRSSLRLEFNSAPWWVRENLTTTTSYMQTQLMLLHL